MILSIFGRSLLPPWWDVEKVYIKEVDIPTSFAESRDWFELFFDDVFAPPKLFNIVIQWLAPRQHGD